MKLLSYTGTRKGIGKIGSILIRMRLSGIKEAFKLLPHGGNRLRASHSEIMFEPQDGVDHLMPDGTTEPNANGEFWCCSSVAIERLPASSPIRALKIGGVRFKRIRPDLQTWEQDNLNFDPYYAATWAHVNQGRKYDWQLIIGFIAFFIPNKETRVMCSEACAEMLGLIDSYRFDPCSLQSLVKGSNKISKNE